MRLEYALITDGDVSFLELCLTFDLRLLVEYTGHGLSRYKWFNRPRPEETDVDNVSKHFSDEFLASGFAVSQVLSGTEIILSH